MLDEKTITEISDKELLARLAQHRHCEHVGTLEVLRHLNEVERRNLHLKLGYPSLFDYCVQQLKYSESAAGRRIQVARCLRKFRAVERLLQKNELSLSTICLIARILNDQNVDATLSKVRGMSRREVETLVANHLPPVTLRDRVQPVRVVVPEPATVDHSRRGSGEVVESTKDSFLECTSHCVEKTSEPPAPRTETKVFIQFLAGQDFMKKYEEAAALLSNQLGKLSMEAVFTAMLDEFIERHSPKARQERREARNPTVKTPVRGGGSRAISQATRDKVAVRDNSRCAYVGGTGHRCTETRNLHVDHVVPVARNGTSDARNLRLLCARHNQLEADRVLGKAIMNRYRHAPPH